jgi:hypothetical protein
LFDNENYKRQKGKRKMERLKSYHEAVGALAYYAKQVYDAQCVGHASNNDGPASLGELRQQAARIAENEGGAVEWRELERCCQQFKNESQVLLCRGAGRSQDHPAAAIVSIVSAIEHLAQEMVERHKSSA